MAGLRAPVGFDVELDGGRGNAARWAVWIRRFELYL